MIVVIQCAATKAQNAGYWRDRNGRPVSFVADPSLAPAVAGLSYARPDDLTPLGTTYRQELLKYNESPGNNSLGLLPAWKLYQNPAYARLVSRFGINNLYILSAGWGLIHADFLTPYYDITYSASADDFKRRRNHEKYLDLQMISPASSEPITFLGGKDYLPLFSRLVAKLPVHKVVYYNSASKPTFPGIEFKRFATATRTNWHYECANALCSGKLVS